MRSIGYCCRYVWKTSPKYIVLLVLVSVLTAAFNVINLLILRLITESLAANNTYSFCIALLILVIAAIAGVIVGRGTMDQTHPLRLTQTGQACRKVI